MKNVKPSSASKSKSVKVVSSKRSEPTIAVEKKGSSRSIKSSEGRRPLYEPKTRVQLPPRKKTKIQRWPVINLPPLKRKPWDPEKVRNLPPPKPKVVIDLPPLKTKPWIPPTPSKPKPKPKIEYPPLTMRTKPKQPKKPKQRPKPVRLEKTHFPIRPSTLDKAWHNFKCRGDKFMILRGNFSLNHKKFNDLSTKMTSTDAVVCLVYTHLHPVSTWKSHDLDKILDVGFVLYRESISKKKSIKELRPDQVNPIIYVDLQKISVNVGKHFNTVCLGVSNNNLLLDIENGVKEMLDKTKQCILNYGDKNYAMWMENGAFYVFIPEDTDEEGLVVKMNQGMSCVIRCTDMSYLMEYMTQLLIHTPSVIVCRIYSFELLKVLQMQQHPDKSLFEEQTQEKKQRLRALMPKDPDKDKLHQRSDKSIIVPTIDEPYSFRETLVKHFNVTHLSKDYKKITDTRGILRGMEYNTSPSKTPILCAACIIMQNKYRSSTWTMHTLHDIFSLADSILIDNPSLLDTFPTISDLTRVSIHFDDQIYNLLTENVIFGQIVSQSTNIADLYTAVREFLTGNDIGVIDGPQLIPIWQEAGLYFMFDAKERDEEGRKFGKSGRNDAKHGSACVLWFKSLDELIDMYMSNVPQKHMKDLFKIVKVEAVPYISKSPDWHSWKGLATDKWILRGTFDETSDKFEKENRGKQGVCMAAVAIAYTKLTDVSKWTTKVIDKILCAGDEFYTITVVKLRFKKKFVSPLLKVDELDTQMKLNDTLIRLHHGKIMFNGSLTAKDDEKDRTLLTVLTNFFRDHKSGILVSCHTAVALFKVNDEFYVFDPLPRNDQGDSLEIKAKNKSHTGLACAMRFTSIDSVAKTLLNNFSIKDSPEFNINALEASIHDDKEKPELHHYQDFLNYRFAGILRATSNLHENSDIFPIKSQRKTYSNLVVALAMSEVIPSIYWTNKQINEILTMGYELMLQIPSTIDKSWLLNHCKIGSNHFKIDDKEKQCVFFLNERLTEEETVENVSELNTVDGEDGRTQETVKNTPDEAEDDQEESLEVESSKDLSPKTTIETQIQSLSSQDVVWIVLESTIFCLAVWKQDGLYYMFDPNETLSNGKFTKQRLEMIRKLINEENLRKQVEQIRKLQVDTSEKPEMEVINDELRRYAIPEAYPSIMHLPKSVHQLEVKRVDDEEALGASVIVFSNEKLLLKHLLLNLPEENRYDEFTWHVLTIKNELPLQKRTFESKTWNHFSSHTHKHWILRGLTSQKDDRFNYDNSQDISNSIVALTFVTNVRLTGWTSEIIDVALKYGTRLYSSSLYQVRKSNATLATMTRLNIDQLIDSFVIGKTRFVIKCEMYEPEKFTVVDEKEMETKDAEKGKGKKSEKPKTPVKGKKEQEKVPEPPKPYPSLANLTKYLKEFFVNNIFGVLVSKKYAVAVFKDTDYYMFDPHNTGPDGIRRENGVASLNRYTSLDDLSLTYLSSIEQLETGPNTFELYKIEIDSNLFLTDNGNKSKTTTEGSKQSVNQ